MKTIRLTEQDITNIVRRVLMEQTKFADIVQQQFTRYTNNLDKFKEGIIDSEETFRRLINWFNNREDEAIKILMNFGLTPKTETLRFDNENAKSNIQNLIHSITDDLATLSMYPSNVINVRFITNRINKGEIDNQENFKITERYNNYPEVLFKIYQQQLKVIGK